MTIATAATAADPVARPIPGACDVVVVGAGPAGAACAIELAGCGLDVLLAERGDYRAHRIGETLAPAGHGPLAGLGAARVLTDPPHRRALALRSVWGQSRAREHSYMFEPYAVGWHLDRAAFDASLAALAVARGVRVALNERVVELEPQTGGWRLRFAGARGSDALTRCRFIVDGTGRPAAIARRLGARIEALDRLVAHYRLLPVPGDQPEPVTMIEAIREGWLYTAPLPDGRMIAALLTDHGGKSRGRRELWRRSLACAPDTAARLEPTGGSGLRTASARSTLTIPPSGNRWLAVGDAACARDPLAGDGIMLALSDGIRAARAVHDALDGDSEVLRRRAEQLAGEHADYLAARAHAYALERRWPHARFWRERARPRSSPSTARTQQRRGEADHGHS